jgi:hypothetical protein
MTVRRGEVGWCEMTQKGMGHMCVLTLNFSGGPVGVCLLLCVCEYQPS